MKRICFTYHMGKPGETAETCITLPMEDKMADEILNDPYGHSSHLDPAEGWIGYILQGLAAIQGYAFHGVVHVKENPLVIQDD